MNPPLQHTIAYSPENELLERIVARSVGIFDDPMVNTIAFSNSSIMQAFLQNNNLLAGIEFPDAYVVSICILFTC